MMKKKLIFKNFIVLICISSLLVLSACGKESANKVSKKVINIGITNSPGNLNPIDPADTSSGIVASILFEPLMDLDSDMKYKPMLADSVKTNDNKVFTVNLNKKAKWTDGRPVTADDVIFTLKLLTDSKISSMAASNFNILEGLDDKGFTTSEGSDFAGAKKIDDHTVQFTTKSTVSLILFEDLICKNLRTVPKHKLSNIAPVEIAKSSFIQNPTVTDGAFSFIKYERDQYVQLKANKNYFRGIPKIDELNFKVMQGTNLAIQLQKGEVDMNIGAIPVDDYSKVKSLSNVKTFSGQPNNLQFLFINEKSVPNAKVRKAISYAINRKQIVQNLLKGQGKAVDGFFSEGNPYYNKNIPQVTYDVSKAKALLKEAGWDSNKVLTFNVPTGNTTREQAADIIVASLKDIGVNVQVQKFDFATTQAKAKTGQFDLTIMGDTIVPINPTYDLPFFILTGNYNGYSNKVVDNLILSVKSEANEGKVKADYNKLQEILAEDVPCPVVYAASQLTAVNKRVITGKPKDYGTFIDVYNWNVAK